MLVYRRIFICIFWLIFLAFAPSASAIHDQYLVYFPQVARGVVGNRLATIIVVSNPNSEPVEVTLNSNNSRLLSKATFLLRPGETRQINISGDDLQVGWVSLESTKVVAAAAHILTKRSSKSIEIISQVTVLPELPVSKVSIPVFRRSDTVEAEQVETLADNTGVAIASVQPGKLLLTLRDREGNTISSRVLVASSSNPARDFASHIAIFVTELFASVPKSFTVGSLAVEHIEPKHTARAFAVTAIYMKNDQMWGADVTSIDVAGSYVVKFKSSAGIQEMLKELSNQYGFAVNEFLTADTVIITALDAVALAVARDPRVERVRPNSVIEVAT